MKPGTHVGSVVDLYKIGCGPSSSHSIGPHRAALLFLEHCGTPPAKVRVTLFGSLSLTGRGHFTDASLADALGDIPLEAVWDRDRQDPPHPNTMLFEALDSSGEVTASWEVMSVGGGALRDATGPIAALSDAEYPFGSIAEATARCREKSCAFWQLVQDQEPDLFAHLDCVWSTMTDSVERGLATDETLLPGSLRLRRRASSLRARARGLDAPQRDIALLAAFSLAAAEENAGGGVIVTAPSCGPAGVVPGVLYYYEHIQQVPRREILRALATAGLFGAVIRANASISGAEAGCQAEIGSACSMAAAAACQILGGSLAQIEYAAEIAMEHHLGLTCDPVEGYVQIPCIERNMTACLRAFECATYALLTDGDHLISFDGVVEVMYETGRDLQSAYRETAAGGLAKLWRRRLDANVSNEEAP